MSRPLWFIKNCLVKDFDKWVSECPTTRQQAGSADVLEFLIQKGLLKGKYFNDYIDTLPALHFPEYIELGSLQPLMEGYIPPRTWFGRNKKKTEDKQKEPESNGTTSKTEEVEQDLIFSMVLSGANDGPIVIKKETANQIISILHAAGKENAGMKITYTLSEKDIKEMLADHFETTPEDIEIRDKCPDLNRTDIEITVVQYPE